MAIPYP